MGMQLLVEELVVVTAAGTGLAVLLRVGTWHVSFPTSEVALPVPHVGWLTLPTQAEPPSSCLCFCRNPSLARKGTRSLALPCSQQQTLHPSSKVSSPLDNTRSHFLR